MHGAHPPPRRWRRRRDSLPKRREAGPDPTGTWLSWLSLLHKAGGGHPGMFGCHPPIWLCDISFPKGEAGREDGVGVWARWGGAPGARAHPDGDDPHRQPALRPNANNIIPPSLPWSRTVLPKCLKNASPQGAVALKSKLNLHSLCCACLARPWGHPMTIPGEAGNYRV